MAASTRGATTSVRRRALHVAMPWLVALAVLLRGAATGNAAATSLKWVDQDVSFRAGGLTVFATYRHPVSARVPLPAVLLIAGSGPTDRNGNSTVEPGPIDTLETMADWLSADGVASLRYDKLGSGETGLGSFASHVDSIGLRPFEQESLAALKFLAAQKGVDDHRLGVFGHSEGALFALLLATGHAGAAPPIHALGLFEPLSLRYLTLITVQVDAQVAAQLKAKEISSTLAATVDETLNRAVTRLRATGTVAASLPYGLDSLLNPATAKFLYQADQFDPKTLAAALPATTPVLLTCSNADVLVSCSQVGRIASGLTSAGVSVTFVHLKGIDHVLKVDASRTGANYSKDLPFSPVLKKVLARFVATSL